MGGFGHVDLPFAEEAGEDLGSSRTYLMAAARELVLAELKRTPESWSRWEAVDATSIEEQERNAACYRSFVAQVRRRCVAESGTSFSPISGESHGVRGGRGDGPLDLVAVAAPPLTLLGFSRNAADDEMGRDGVGLRLDDRAAEEERPLLQSSTQLSREISVGEMPAWTPQHAVSQSMLDGVLFEALLSQHVSLSLWGRCSNPDETLQGMLHHVQRIDKSLCEQKSLLDFINAARFTEQRTYKRRRVELESQAAKSRAKVSSLEQLLKVGVAEEAANSMSAAERLRLWLLE
ncbi:hypothetical protein N2W54_004469 [Lotmaria passim]